MTVIFEFSSTPFIAFELLQCFEIKRKSSRLLKRVFLSKRGFNQAPLRCISGDEVTKVLKEVHSRDCDEHQLGL